MRTYSISDAARLLGVSPATVSRQLPAERATRGRSARLSVAEVTEIAAAIHVDPVLLQLRVELAEAYGSDMPAESGRWTTLAFERNLQAALVAHLARIPGDLLPQDEAAAETLPRPWGVPHDWERIANPEALDALVPPLDQ
jgi:hypothetical protein